MSASLCGLLILSHIDVAAIALLIGRCTCKVMALSVRCIQAPDGEEERGWRKREGVLSLELQRYKIQITAWVLESTDHLCIRRCSLLTKTLSGADASTLYLYSHQRPLIYLGIITSSAFST